MSTVDDFYVSSILPEWFQVINCSLRNSWSEIGLFFGGIASLIVFRPMDNLELIKCAMSVKKTTWTQVSLNTL